MLYRESVSTSYSRQFRATSNSADLSPLTFSLFPVGLHLGDSLDREQPPFVTGISSFFFFYCFFFLFFFLLLFFFFFFSLIFHRHFSYLHLLRVIFASPVPFARVILTRSSPFSAFVRSPSCFHVRRIQKENIKEAISQSSESNRTESILSCLCDKNTNF